MKVIDHEPNFWFLLEDAGLLFLDANCSHSAFGYSYSIQLNQEETEHYQRQGREYISSLAEDIQNGAPILEISKSKFKTRKIPMELEATLDSAIAAWRGSKLS